MMKRQMCLALVLLVVAWIGHAINRYLANVEYTSFARGCASSGGQSQYCAGQARDYSRRGH